MHALTLLLALAGPAEPVDPAVEPAAPAAQVAAPASSSTTLLGVALVAGGTATAAASSEAFTLIEALATPDRPGNAVDKNVETFNQAAGFTAIALASVSAVVVVVGAGLLLVEEDSTAPAAAPQPTP